MRNAIFDDFLTHLEQIETAISQFAGKNVETWLDDDWRGFYMALYKFLREDGTDWGPVSNRSGGFLGFWWHGCPEKFVSTLGYKPYLQIETRYNNETNFKLEPATVAENRRHDPQGRLPAPI